MLTKCSTTKLWALPHNDSLYDNCVQRLTIGPPWSALAAWQQLSGVWAKVFHITFHFEIFTERCQELHRRSSRCMCTLLTQLWTHEAALYDSGVHQSQYCLFRLAGDFQGLKIWSFTWSSNGKPFNWKRRLGVGFKCWNLWHEKYTFYCRAAKFLYCNARNIKQIEQIHPTNYSRIWWLTW